VKINAGNEKLRRKTIARAEEQRRKPSSAGGDIRRGEKRKTGATKPKLKQIGGEWRKLEVKIKIRQRLRQEKSEICSIKTAQDSHTTTEVTALPPSFDWKLKLGNVHGTLLL
jgi:hypothetical protein